MVFGIWNVRVVHETSKVCFNSFMTLPVGVRTGVKWGCFFLTDLFLQSETNFFFKVD